MTQIALFGTSADPPTIGHRSILSWLSDHYDYVAVWAADNPFKEHGATLNQRTEMLELLIEDLARTNVSVEHRLSDRRSLNTLHHAQRIWGHEPDYFLVIGSDLVSQIPRWYRAKDLLQVVTLLIFPRKGYPLRAEALQHLKALKGRWLEADYTPPAVSSTDYRNEGKSGAVIEAIATYIAHHHLYQ